MVKVMNINYHQTTGLLTDDLGKILVPAGQAWAGRGRGKNNPAMEMEHDTGPLPKGMYRVGTWSTHAQLGPNSATLTQTSGESYGRSGFYIHGAASLASGEHGQESKGCIVITHDYRMQLINLDPDTITVIE